MDGDEQPAPIRQLGDIVEIRFLLGLDFMVLAGAGVKHSRAFGGGGGPLPPGGAWTVAKHFGE